MPQRHIKTLPVHHNTVSLYGHMQNRIACLSAEIKSQEIKVYPHHKYLSELTLVLNLIMDFCLVCNRAICCGPHWLPVELFFLFFSFLEAPLGKTADLKSNCLKQRNKQET